jgi:hypothetical protein
MRKLFLIAAVAIAASSLIFWSCQKEENPNQEEIFQKNFDILSSNNTQNLVAIDEAKN